jgi:hypothetical protein
MSKATGIQFIYTGPAIVCTEDDAFMHTSPSLESSEDIDDSHIRGHERTHRSRARAADPVEELREADQNSKSQKTRRKR